MPKKRYYIPKMFLSTAKNTYKAINEPPFKPTIHLKKHCAEVTARIFLTPHDTLKNKAELRKALKLDDVRFCRSCVPKLRAHALKALATDQRKKHE